ncbi:peptide chain release factor N(5)-glutamine methyltransferase [Roseiarcaceae bacterium H3SJ34-1]|uniref:peptide chain release factor N(5)-glutamine methyltransferase n=1 Tax=Terripilifer ovatus TaxID=3032367 RepID=UPI003AB94DF7|nr:peptide chain release factor N(5)-glutamine methyltransferase [Roseiarcaceae bacterium H3SJ34-1]
MSGDKAAASSGGLSAERTIAEAFAALETAFVEAGITTPGFDARVLLEDATGLNQAALRAGSDRKLGGKAVERLAQTVARRIAREPVTRILGSRGFWTLDLKVTPDVLDPRGDTETVVEAVIDCFRGRRDQPLRILDLGTGSGALLCALLSEFPAATGLGVDISEAACAVATENLKATGLNARGSIRRGDWMQGIDEEIDGRFDVIVSNPPYIESGTIAGLEPEVRCFDPHLALDGGADGLVAYREIAAGLARILDPEGGMVFVEIGCKQAGSVTAIMEAAGVKPADVARDLSGNDRVVFGPLMPEPGNLS